MKILVFTVLALSSYVHAADTFLIGKDTESGKLNIYDSGTLASFYEFNSSYNSRLCYKGKISEAKKIIQRMAENSSIPSSHLSEEGNILQDKLKIETKNDQISLKAKIYSAHGSYSVARKIKVCDRKVTEVAIDLQLDEVKND